MKISSLDFLWEQKVVVNDSKFLDYAKSHDITLISLPLHVSRLFQLIFPVPIFKAFKSSRRRATELTSKKDAELENENDPNEKAYP